MCARGVVFGWFQSVPIRAVATFPASKLGRLSYVSLRLVLYIWLKAGVFAPAEGAICVMILPQKVGHAPCFVYVFSRIALLEPL